MDRSISTTLQITADAILWRLPSIGEVMHIVQLLCIWLHLLQLGKPASTQASKQASRCIPTAQRRE